MDGNLLPTLVYMAREKKPKHHHNFKAGAMNALVNHAIVALCVCFMPLTLRTLFMDKVLRILINNLQIRVSSEISNNPFILNVDCDMYSNNSESIRDALCFLLDEEKGQNIGFVQYPQNFDNVTKCDLYGNSINVINKVELPGFDFWGGPLYIGTGCFHRREVLCGRKYNSDYKENWKRRIQRKVEDTTCILEERAKALVSCNYEHNTLWGKEMGLKYGSAVEDVLTGLSIQCKGWRSVYFDPKKKGFLGVVPTTLAQVLTQHKRWSEGLFQIFLSRECPFIQGYGRLKLGLQMAYGIYGLWAPNSIPTLYYLVIPSLCFLKGISLFPKVSSLWFIPFSYVIITKYIYSLVESLQHGDTLIMWWNLQRMWVLKRTTSYLYGTIDNTLKLVGFSNLAFSITAKVSDEDVLKRYEDEMMEFGSSCSMYVIIATIAMLNLVCLMGGVQRVSSVVDPLITQLVLCGAVVAINLPIYKALLFRKDKGKIPPSVTFASIAFAVMACLLPIV